MIEWCNENVGFISALLTLISLLLSITAITVSLDVAKLPFKKKIAVSFFTNLGVGLSNGVDYYSIETTNIGNRKIKLNFVGIMYRQDRKWVRGYSKIYGNPTNVMLDINETADTKYSISDINNLIKTTPIYAIAIDVEGKIYKRKIK